MVKIESKIVKTDVTCVKCFQNFVLAGYIIRKYLLLNNILGIGSDLYVFKKDGKLLQTFNIFHGKKIHGIIPNSTNKIAVFGANQIKILEFDFIKSEIINELVNRNCDDWIFYIQWLDSDVYLATIFAHNYISLWNSSDLSLATSIGCKQSCTLYSATLVNNTWNDFFVLSGTVFGQILIWKPSSGNIYADVIYKLEGHDGAVFAIAYSNTLNYLVTTSDDRTVRIWSTPENIFSDDYKILNNIVLKHTMYGHIARVFRCKIMQDFVVTAGEDSFVHIWNMNNGSLVRKFETHQGGCVWALDICDKDKIIVTGGGDSGVSFYPLTLKNDIETLDIVEHETPRVLKMTAAGNVVVVMDGGLIKFYNTALKIWSDVDVHKNLKSYAIVVASENKELIAVAGIQGSIYIYKEENSLLILLTNLAHPDGNRIFSLHWLTPYMFLTCSINGLMHIWFINKHNQTYELQKMDYKCILPTCKERWATCAVLCSENFIDFNVLDNFDKLNLNLSLKLVVGDRKGNLHLYQFDKEDCIQTIKKAHCHLGVTNLFFNDDHLYSLGRNGILNKYNLDSLNNCLLLVTSDKLPFPWLCSMKKYNNTNILMGFSGSNFIIFNLNYRRIILKINCGGGHRSWDCMVTNSNLLHLYFIKEKRLNVYSEKWSNILTSNFVDGYHTKEINCGAVIKHSQCNNEFLFLSGGEDTTIRLTIVNLKTSKFETINSIKSHLSSVRCITHCLLFENECKKEILILSGGGRAQIILQKLSIYFNTNKFECQLLHSYYKPLEDEEAETRIMDVITFNLEKNILVIAGCSDGNLKCFNITNETLKLQFLYNIIYAQKCIIRISYINISNKHIIISMATDGKIVFWDFSNICVTPKSNDILNDITLKPFFEIQAHQSGINSFNFQKINNTKYILVTGGDDNLITLNVIHFVIDESDIKINLICRFFQPEVHGAQITGVFINESHFITSSIDQNISVFKYKLENDSLSCNLLTQYCSAVSDPQGMKCILSENEIVACVFGKGIEICSINDLNSSDEVILKSIFGTNRP